MLASASVLAAAALPANAGAQEQPEGATAGAVRVLVLKLSGDVTPQRLAGIPGASVGLMSGGIGGVPRSQTYLDIGQGARTNSSLYDSDVPLLLVDFSGRIPAPSWRAARERAAGAPAEIVPGLLASTLAAHGVAVRATPRVGGAAAIATREDGRVRISSCLTCPGLTVTSGSLARARSLAGGLGPRDLLVAFESPPAAPQHQLALAIAGLGDGQLVSASTRLPGLVLSTDLAPTVLARFGLEAPAQMNGEPVQTEGAPDPAAVGRLDARLAEIRPRRNATVGVNLLIWIALTALAGIGGLITRIAGLRAAVPILALSAVYLPLLLLLSAALDPSPLAERLIVGVGAPVLALGTRLLVRGWGALAIAAGTTTLAYAVDVIAGSPLSRLSIGGPNPSLGVRFFGIGNELEAILAVLTLLGAGAALSAWAPRASPSRIAAGFAVATVLAVGAFAPGRFGADVGIAIGLPAGAAVAAAISLRAGWRRSLLILAAPALAVALIAAIDLIAGGGAHLSRSVLQAGGLDSLGDVAERRLRLGAGTFSRYGGSPVLWLCAVLLAAGVLFRDRVRTWFKGSDAAWAGFAGAVVATIVGTLANDSGALLLMIGVSLTSLCAGFAWATRPGG